MKTNNIQEVGGNHYEKFKIEPVNIMVDYGLNWFQGEALKYVSRYRDKGGVTDLNKAIHVMSMAEEMKPLTLMQFESDPSPLEDYCVQFKGVYNDANIYRIFCLCVIRIVMGQYKVAQESITQLKTAVYGED